MTEKKQGNVTSITRQFGSFQDKNHEDEQLETIDYKMVTFSLGGKDYGINIMKVKEIAKFGNFTYVPNTPPFVVGVYNLRGDIISIIDLRRMFNLPTKQRREGESEDGLILRLEDNLIGVIVDSIDRVVGVSSARIQPPHPIFGDINIKYISGVIEKDGRLYIILDADRIFSKDQPDKKSSTDEELRRRIEIVEGTDEKEVIESAATVAAAGDQQDLDFGFVKDTLRTFVGFHHSTLNHEWIEKRYLEWREERVKDKQDVQFTDEGDAQEFLRPFYSPYTNTFWEQDYIDDLLKLLPEPAGPIVTVWNPGCGKGYETYSLAGLLKHRFPDKGIKIWAGDNDLLSISTAPNLVFRPETVTEFFEPFVVEGKNGCSFTSEIKDGILFEYHDIKHGNSIPACDVVMARDLLSFFPEDTQNEILEQMHGKLRDNGILILGSNEKPGFTAEWFPVQNGEVTVYQKK